MNTIQPSTEPFQILNRNRICLLSGPTQRDLANTEAGAEVPGADSRGDPMALNWLLPKPDLGVVPGEMAGLHLRGF